MALSYQHTARLAVINEKQKKKQYKYSTTSADQERILKVTKQLGYKRPIQFLEDLALEGSLDNVMKRIYEDRIKVHSLPLMTTVNMIRAGINVEDNKNRLVSEVEQLWRDIK